MGVIEESVSPWAAPVVLVKKKSGELRFCTDFRGLNAVTKKYAMPLPNITELLDSLGGAKYFSSLDLRSGYYQVPIHPDDREKTAFTCTAGLFQYKKMAMGLTGAPATFSALMAQVLAGLQWTTCLVYLDDLIVLGRTLEEHLKNLEQVLECLEEVDLKLKPTKCQFARKEVDFLGHVVSAEGLKPDPKKIEAVKNWETPQNSDEVRSFVAFCNYYRRFVKNFSQTAKPLNNLQKKGEGSIGC